MEEPEEYVVEEKTHFISKRVEAEPAEGIPSLKLTLALCVFGLSHSLCFLQFITYIANWWLSCLSKQISYIVIEKKSGHFDKCVL